MLTGFGDVAAAKAATTPPPEHPSDVIPTVATEPGPDASGVPGETDPGLDEHGGPSFIDPDPMVSGDV